MNPSSTAIWPAMLLRLCAISTIIIGTFSLPARMSYASDGFLHGVKQVTTGETHSCALLEDTTVACWGRNADGELSNPYAGPESDYPVLVYASASTPLSGIVSVAAAGLFTCALQNTGSVYCWGKNAYGSLGNGSTSPSSFTTKVLISEPVSAISVGGYHGCAILDTPDKPIRCWGDNSSGQLGDTTTTDSSRPVDVQKVSITGGTEGFTGADEVSAGGSHTCARTGTVSWCWGSNANGQLGNGTFTNRPFAIPVKDGTGKDILIGATQLSAGGSHTCASFFSGSATAQCWGDNGDGQLGNAMTGDSSSLPVTVDGIGVKWVSSGGYHSAAVLADGRVATWGGNDQGQLGNNGNTDSQTPVVLSIVNADQISSSHFHTCATLIDGRAMCWGRDDWGQIGDDAPPSPTRHPVYVLQLHYADRIFADDFD